MDTQRDMDDKERLLQDIREADGGWEVDGLLREAGEKLRAVPQPHATVLA